MSNEKKAPAAGAAVQEEPEKAVTVAAEEAEPALPEDKAESEPDMAVALNAAREEADSQRNLYLRTAAELENVRRRAERDVAMAHRYGMERFAREILAVKDSIEMGLQAVEASGEQGPAAEGFRATLKQLGQCLDKFEIGEIDPLGEPFDPELHEAMATQPAEGSEPDVVITVVQKGYRIHERLLRPARVIVARAPDA